MSDNKPTRRQFVAAASAASLAAAASTTLPAYGKSGTKGGKLAIHGGEPVRKNKRWPEWPYRDENVLKSIEETTRSGIWWRIQDQNNGTSRLGRTEVPGPKYRMNEFEAAILLGRWPGVQERFALRNANAAHLTARLKGFPGVTLQKLYGGTESGAFYGLVLGARRKPR